MSKIYNIKSISEAHRLLGVGHNMTKL